MRIASLSSTCVIPYRNDRTLIRRIAGITRDNDDDFNFNLLLTIITMGRHIELGIILRTKNRMRTILQSKMTAEICKSLIDTVVGHDISIVIDIIRTLRLYITLTIDYRMLITAHQYAVKKIIEYDNNLDNCWSFLELIGDMECDDKAIDICKCVIGKIGSDHERLCRLLMINVEAFRQLFIYSKIPLNIAWDCISEDNTTHSVQVMEILMILT